MSLKLSKQEQKVYDFIRDNPGCTTHDITIHTFVQKPCARVVGLESKGIVIERRGEVKYGDSRPFKKLYLAKPLTKQKSTFVFDKERECMVELKETVTL